jgi:UDP-GlcNAc:undecaprenyl-phosphate GlcNAc-1-phosphate transferase
MALLALLVALASAYLVYVLEILKFRRLEAVRLRRLRPETTEAEIDADVERRLETGEFPALSQRP